MSEFTQSKVNKVTGKKFLTCLNFDNGISKKIISQQSHRKKDPLNVKISTPKNKKSTKSQEKIHLCF